jgi:hypothetical protein
LDNKKIITYGIGFERAQQYLQFNTVKRVKYHIHTIHERICILSVYDL